jgi:hypothetical protein
MYTLRTNDTNSMMSAFRIARGKLIENTKNYLVVKPLQSLLQRKPLEGKLQYMWSLSENTVGHDLAKMLDEKALKLIPGFELHDLNHLILGYGMDTEDELRMQAYLVGNGYFKLHCFLFLCSGVLLPEIWRDLYAHYQLGRQRESLSSLSLDEYMEEETALVRRKYCAITKREMVPVLFAVKQL